MTDFYVDILLKSFSWELCRLCRNNWYLLYLGVLFTVRMLHRRPQSSIDINISISCKFCGKAVCIYTKYIWKQKKLVKKSCKFNMCLFKSVKATMIFYLTIKNAINISKLTAVICSNNQSSLKILLYPKEGCSYTALVNDKIDRYHIVL